jgi:hypothetical protein
VDAVPDGEAEPLAQEVANAVAAASIRRRYGSGLMVVVL